MADDFHLPEVPKDDKKWLVYGAIGIAVIIVAYLAWVNLSQNGGSQSTGSGSSGSTSAAAPDTGSTTQDQISIATAEEGLQAQLDTTQEQLAVNQQQSSVANGLAYIQGQAQTALNLFTSSLSAITNTQAAENTNSLAYQAGQSTVNIQSLTNAFNSLFAPDSALPPIKGVSNPSINQFLDTNLGQSAGTTQTFNLLQDIEGNTPTSAQTSTQGQTQASSLLSSLTLPSVTAPQISF